MTLEYRKLVLLQALIFRRLPEKNQMSENSGGAVVQAGNHEGRVLAEPGSTMRQHKCDSGIC